MHPTRRFSSWKSHLAQPQDEVRSSSSRQADTRVWVGQDATGMLENGEVAANKLMAAYQLRLKRGMGNVERGVRKSSSTVRTGNLPRVLPANWTYQAREGERVKGARIPGSYIVWGKAGLRGDLLKVNLKEGMGGCVSVQVECIWRWLGIGLGASTRIPARLASIAAHRCGL